MRASEQRFASAFEYAAIGMALLTPDGRFTQVNQAACTILGYSAEELLNLTFQAITHPDDLGADLDYVEKILAGVIPNYQLEKRYVHRSGRIVWAMLSVSLLRNDQNEPLYFISQIQDITERTRAEARRLDLERQVQYAQKLESLGVLAGGIAHDFNNLLTSILGYSDLLQAMAEPGTAMYDYIHKVVDGAKQAAALTQQMLAYSGKGRFSIEPVSLPVMVRDIGQLLGISICKKCTLEYQFSPDVPNIDADPTQIRQVIMNLILNASEAMLGQGGEILVQARLALGEDPAIDFEPRLPAGRYALLEVSDHGCGMSEETQRKVFDPFFTTKVTGRGLGLAVVLGIVRGHGGAIRVRSELGRGTTFQVLLPASTLPAPPPSRSPIAVPSWKSSGVVLIVDDEESVRTLTRVMVQKMGFTVLTANDGEAAVAMFRAHSTTLRLVLLDMTMPNLDGDEAFRLMQEIQSDVPVIVSSGYSEQTTASRFVGTSPAGFIQKPYRYPDLVTVFRQVLEG